MTGRSSVKWSSHTAVVAERARQGAHRGMDEATKQLLEMSNDLVPVDTGALRDSGVASVQAELTVVHGQVAYGTTQYTDIEAIEQHERLDFGHAVGQAKFLEQPFFANADTLRDTMAKGIAEAFGGAE
jgi:hypothetical protein